MGGAQSTFQGNENSLYDPVTVDTCHFHLSRPIECTTPGEDPRVNYGLGQ